LYRYKEAIESLKQAMRLRPDFAEASNDLGVAYAGNHQYKQAIESFSRAILLEPDLPDSHFNLGAVYLALNDKGAALEQYRKLQLVDPDRANKLYGVIYKGKLLVIKKKNHPDLEMTEHRLVLGIKEK
jgi:protein O-GlcNAc transferase